MLLSKCVVVVSSATLYIYYISCCVNTKSADSFALSWQHHTQASPVWGCPTNYGACPSCPLTKYRPKSPVTGWTAPLCCCWAQAQDNTQHLHQLMQLTPGSLIDDTYHLHQLMLVTSYLDVTCCCHLQRSIQPCLVPLHEDQQPKIVDLHCPLQMQQHHPLHCFPMKEPQRLARGHLHTWKQKLSFFPETFEISLFFVNISKQTLNVL